MNEFSLTSSRRPGRCSNESGLKIVPCETAAELSMKIQLVYKAKSRVLKRLTEEVEEINEDFSWLDAI